MITQKNTANAIGGKTARACESCLKKRAKWFCSADDAFLCRACDSLVHSANELATRHKRVCLDTNPATKPVPLPTPTTPSWHQGFTKKARTPRNNTKAVKHSHKNSSQMPVVPEVGNEDDEDEGVLVEETKVQESDHMIFSVPNLDDHPFQNNEGLYIKDNSEFNISLVGFDGDSEWDVNYLPSVGFSDNELADFAADVESLLEQNEEEAAVKGEGEKDDLVQHVWYPGMKVEEEGDISTTTDHCCYFDWSIDVEREMFNYDLNDNCWKNDDQSQVSGVDQEVEAGNIEQVVVPKEEYGELVAPSMENNASNKKRRILLRLNYEEVINAWASQGCSSPWTTGHRPNFNLDHHGWPNCMGDLWPTGVDRQAGEWMGVSGSVNSGDGARKARVSRYREKRRTRLFSKKIRYEVRKLNAEKRPRLKGRFVKRTSLSSAVGVGVGVQSSSSFPYLNG